MKILLHTLMILFLCLPGYKAQAVNTDPCGLNPSIKVKVTIDMGRKKKGCTGFGICSITVTAEGDFQPISVGTTRVGGEASIVNGKLYIEFDRSSIPQSVYNTYFAGDRFKVEEDYELPKDLTVALGVRSYTVKAGTYAAPSQAESVAIPVNF